MNLHAYKVVPIDSVTPYANNPRTHSDEQITQIRRSIREFGFTNPLLIDDGGQLIAGHGRLMAAKAEGLTELPAIEVAGLNEAQRKALVLADNQLAANASWDYELLKVELSALTDHGFDLSLVGFTEAELAGILETQTDGLTDPDDAPEAPSVPVSALGDVWICGSHRVMCGDCRDAGHVRKLMNGQAINVAFTSPPYAEQREYDPVSGFRPIPPEEYVEWFASVAGNVAAHLAPDGSWFVNIKPSCDGLDTHLYVLDLVIAHVRQWGWHFATEFCWERNCMPKSVTQRFKNQFEPVYQFARGRWKMRPDAVRNASSRVPRAGGAGVGDTSWANRQGGNGAMFGAAKRKCGTSQRMAGVQGTNSAPGEYIGAGLAYPGNRLPTFSGDHEATGHTAAFPVGLPAFFIEAYSDAGDMVFDPFMGSGSTLIAADRTGRVGCGMEISPAYVDIIVTRWQAFTGETASLEDGRTFAQLKAQRHGQTAA